MTIVHYEHRYKRPKKKKPVALEVPAVVRTEPTRRKPAPREGRGSAVREIRNRHHPQARERPGAGHDAEGAPAARRCR
jgi:hypothetical protein